MKIFNGNIFLNLNKNETKVVNEYKIIHHVWTFLLTQNVKVIFGVCGLPNSGSYFGKEDISNKNLLSVYSQRSQFLRRDSIFLTLSKEGRQEYKMLINRNFSRGPCKLF